MCVELIGGGIQLSGPEFLKIWEKFVPIFMRAIQEKK
jgi:hypothetical protein